MSDHLRHLTDQELDALVDELVSRSEEFDAAVRLQVNDELRRRKKPLIGFGRSRH